MRENLLLLLLTGCAWVTDDELATLQEDCVCPEGGLVYYPDLDGDGFGDGNAGSTCPGESGWLLDARDCDDSDPAVNPDADEVCNGVDDDCDGEADGIDALDQTRWYQDMDGDGWGDPDTWTSACTAPEGYVDASVAEDCDDSRDDVHPETFEVCGDLADNDCDGDPANCRLEGTQTWDTTGLRILGLAAEDGTGWSVAGGKDLTGDGQPDLVVGVDGYEGGASEGGGVFVFAGPFTGDPVLDLDDAFTVLHSTVAGLNAGHSVALMGRHDSGGEPWLAVGCDPTDFASHSGTVYLLNGTLAQVTMGLADNADVILEGAGPGEDYGYGLSSGLDATGDGYTDLAVSAPSKGGGSGEVLFFAGPVQPGSVRDDAVGAIVGGASELLGLTVALVPDVDGDGLADLITSSMGSDSRGKVYLFLSPLDADFSAADAEEVYQGEESGDMLGGLGAAASAGDVNGDGRHDLLLGAPYRGSSQQGAAYLLLGATNPVASLAGAEATITGTLAGGQVGTAATGLDDFDADGLSDLLVGAPGYDGSSSDAGAALLFYGPVEGARTAATADATIQGGSSGAGSGSFVANAGDMDSDGFSDALIGAPGGSVPELGLLLGEGW